MSFERWESLLRDYKAAKATAKGHGESGPRRGPADVPGARAGPAADKYQKEVEYGKDEKTRKNHHGDEQSGSTPAP